MRILFLGDIVGTPGVKLVQQALPIIRERDRIDVVIANAENAAGGSGLTSRLYHRLRRSGVDLMTLGDHIYRKMEIIPTLEKEPHICKPANYPYEAPGRDVASLTMEDHPTIAVISLMGRTFMKPVDCPFHAADRVLKTLEDSTNCIIVDVHAEATADKYLLAQYLDGRVSAVIGTHTHVQTADEQLLPGGTAFLCDAGMCGPHDGVLGRKTDCVLPTTVTFVPRTWDLATNDVRLNGAIIDIETGTGIAKSIERFTFRESELSRHKPVKKDPRPLM